MKIAVVTPVYPNSAEPFRGIFSYRFASALSKLADVEVFCSMPTYPQWLLPATRAYHRADAAATTPGVTAHFLPYSALPYLTRPFNGANCARAMLPALRAFRPDLILAYWLYPEGYGAEIAGAKLGVPVIVEALGSDLRAIPDVISTGLVKKTLRDAAYVLTVSEELRQNALRLGADPARSRTILNGCDASVFRPADRATARRELGVAPDTELVLFVGHLAALKGVHELVDAARTLAATRPKLQVAFIGEGVLEKEMRAAAHITLLGRKDPRDVARWMAACNVLCLPSHTEGCPNVIVEALFCGRPVVASNVGGIPELVDDGCGILTPPRDAARLAAALDAALNRTWDEARIAAHYGRSWDDVARDTMEICRSVIT